MIVFSASMSSSLTGAAKSSAPTEAVLREECEAMRNGSRPGPAQFAQDMFVWRNLFLGQPSGFYIDSGANRFRSGSNTWFFDKCLGW